MSTCQTLTLSVPLDPSAFTASGSTVLDVCGTFHLTATITISNLSQRLLEDGGIRLLEDGGYRLLES